MVISIQEFGNLEPVTAEDEEHLKKEAKKEYNKEYYQKHKEELKEYSKKHNKEYYQKNREKLNERSKEYGRTHKGEKRKYAQEHTEEWKEYSIRWRAANPADFAKTQRKSFAKSHARRKRHLDFVPLNEPFEGSHGHHINQEIVIYMSAEIHRSIRHNVFTGKGMEEINKLAMKFLTENLAG